MFFFQRRIRFWSKMYDSWNVTLLPVFLKNSEPKTGQEHKFWQFWIELLYKLIIRLNKPSFGLLCANFVVWKFTGDLQLQRCVTIWNVSVYTVVHWCELDEVENECILYNFRLFAIFVPKLADLVKVWCSYNKNNFACFFSETSCSYTQFIPS